MLDIPSLPTDSLYKFLALSGVLMAFGSIFFYSKLRLAIRKKIYDVELEQAENEALISYFERQESHSPERLLELRKNTNKARVSVEEIRSLWKDLKNLRVVFYLIIAIGLAMAATGFVLWYSKVQVYQDTLLEFRALELQRSVNQ